MVILRLRIAQLSNNLLTTLVVVIFLSRVDVNHMMRYTSSELVSLRERFSKDSLGKRCTRFTKFIKTYELLVESTITMIRHKHHFQNLFEVYPIDVILLYISFVYATRVH